MKRIHGTVACFTAAIARMPWRSVPACSAATPTMYPGSSSKLTSGTWKLSHRSTKRISLFAASTSIAPPSQLALLHTTPAG